MHKLNLSGCAGVAAAIVLILLLVAGCAPKAMTASKSKLPVKPPASKPIPPELKGVAATLDGLAIFSLLGTAAGVVIYFFAPSILARALSLSAGCGAVCLGALMFRLNLWMVPVGAYALAVCCGLAIVGLVVEVFLRVKAMKPKNAQDALADVPTAVEQTFKTLESIAVKTTTAQTLQTIPPAPVAAT